MKNIITIIIIFTLSIAAGAQDIYPAAIEDNHFSRSASQKGIGISSDVLTLGLPLAAATVTIINKDWQGLKQFGFTALTAGALTIGLKYAIKKERPDHSNFHSMPSGHTCSGFASAAYIQRRYGWKYGAPAFALATYIGWARIYAKKHDFWDVVAGAAIGAGAAYIYTRPYKPKSPQISISPVTDGESFILSTTITF